MDTKIENRRIVERRPLVHCITNMVTVNDCANIVLAAGGSPIMAHHPMEMEEITGGCDALVCNMGATEFFDAMCIAVKHAGKVGHAIVVDPVGCAGSAYRRSLCRQVLDLGSISCIRGNYAEIRALAQMENTGVGVDDPTSRQEDIAVYAKELARQYHTIVAVSGVEDYLTDGEQERRITGGSSMMGLITGAGCMSTALMGAYLGTENSFWAAVSSSIRMKQAGELAEKMTKTAELGTMYFRDRLIDRIYLSREDA